MVQISQKKIAVVSAFAGFGHCSLAMALPVISALGVQCCPVPTSVLSNNTAYPDCFFVDFTDKMQPYLETWEKLGLQFDGIYTGFLGSEHQAAIVQRMLKKFRQPNTVVVVDPVMGDHGKTYRTCTPKVCAAIKELVSAADIITPNLTECCILTGEVYREDFSEEALFSLADKLRALGPKRVVITGVEAGDYLYNVIADYDNRTIHKVRKAGIARCGTGDIFASIVAANAVKNISLTDAVVQASAFISKCIALSEEKGLEPRAGVCFEECLGELIAGSKAKENQNE